MQHSDIKNNNHRNDVHMNKHVVRESCYYQQIRKAVDQQDSKNFALILSMLSQDARDFDQFNQVSTPTDLESNSIEAIFPVQAAKLYGQSNVDRSHQQAVNIQQGHFKDVQLEAVLNPEPLSYKSQQIPPAVMDNLSLSSRAKVDPLITIPIASILTKGSESSTQPNDYSKVSNIHSIDRPNSMDIDAWFNTISAARSLDLVS